MSANTLLAQAADRARIRPTALAHMRDLASRTRRGWIPDDPSDLDEVLCRLPGFDDIATHLAELAAEREAVARDVVLALVKSIDPPAETSVVDIVVMRGNAIRDALAFLGQEGGAA